MRILIAVLLALLVPIYALGHEVADRGTAAPGQQTGLGDAAKVVDAFHDALSRGDRAAAQTLLDDHVQIYEQGWVERSRAEYAAHHLDSDIEFTRSTTQTTTVRSGNLTGGIAYVATEGRVTGTFGGKAVDLVTLETVVLRRLEGTWRITHIHWSSRDGKKQ